MCGIVGILNKSDKTLDIKELLGKISHRGYEQNEFFEFEKGSFGTNRLPIVDIENAKQPIFNEYQSVLAIQNGEIFNHKELREDLTGKGHVFKTESDTETLVHLWEEYGEEMIGHLDSEMFALIIYDFRTDTVFVARDRLGVKPLYYTETQDHIIFASEMKAFSGYDTVTSIKEFPFGHYYKNGVFTQYYNFDDIADTEKGDADVLLNLVEKAVKKRVQTNLPVAVFLSGGVDSSLVMNYATKHHYDVTALILGTEFSSDRLAAEKLCLDKGWKCKVLNAEVNYEEGLKDIIYYLENDNPNIVRHSFANDLISKFAKELGFKIVLTGEGADELFAGYNEFFDVREEKINKGCMLLLQSMSVGNLARIDRLAMRHTIETRCPYFDTELMDYALSVNGAEKKGEVLGKTYTKFLLRKAAEGVLPHEIAFRQKEPFANGAGMDIGYDYKKHDGVLSEIAARKGVTEQAMYTEIYNSFGYNKLEEKRVVVKDNLVQILA